MRFIAYALALLPLVACVQQRSLAGRPCPCATEEGYRCCEAVGRCLPTATPCPGEDAASPDAPPPDGPPPDAPPPCAVAEPDHCQALGSLPVVPQIDGVLECGLELRPIEPVGWEGKPPASPQHAAAFAAAWRPDGIYFFVRVHTGGPRWTPTDYATPPSLSSLHCADAVELYVDSDGSFPAAPYYDAAGTLQIVVGAPASSESSARRAWLWKHLPMFLPPNPWQSSSFASFARPDGYDVEAFVTAADLGASGFVWSAGSHVGINVAIDIPTPGPRQSCQRLAQYSWRVLPDAVPPTDGAAACTRAWCNPRAFCTPQLR